MGEMVPGTERVLRREKEIERLRQLLHMQPDSEEDFPFQGVLLSDAIEQCVAAFKLITPFNRDNLKPASYKLTVGDQYAISGKIETLPDESGRNKIVIPPFAVAIIKTHETVNMPRFLIGRWNIQVSKAYEGLLWVGGPQVDPGYIGYLFCPIYNLRDKAVELTRGMPIAVIDFVRTTGFHAESKRYTFPPKRVLFEDYEPETLVSGLVTGAQARLDAVEKELRTIAGTTSDTLKATSESNKKQLEQIAIRIDNFTLITFSVIAVLFAAVTIFVARSEAPSSWNYIPHFLISGTALFVSVSAWIKAKNDQNVLGRWTWLIVAVLFLLAMVLQFRETDRLHSDVEKLKEEIGRLNMQTKSSTSPSPAAKGPGETPATGNMQKERAVEQKR